MKNILYTISLVLSLSLTPALAATSDAVLQVQRDWASANYGTEGKERKQAFQALVQEADKLVARYPDVAEAHVWAGIVYSTYAGEVSMFSAGKQVKRARAELEQALELNPGVMKGSAYTSMGALLFQIPGFMGGDDEQAGQLLRKGLEQNPEGIDANYFYGKFLLDQKRDEEARQYFLKAKQAAPRPDRPLADQGRQEEIAAALADLGQ